MLSDKWKNLRKPSSDNELSTKLALSDHPLELVYIRDGLGREGFGFINHDFKEPKNIKQYKGIDILSKNNADDKYFMLFLTEKELYDQFKYITIDILKNTQNIKKDDYSSATETIIKILKKWDELLKNTRKGLDLRKQMGLYGELVFIRDFLAPTIGLSNAISSWKDGEQDFEFNKILLEIKTQDAAKDAKIMISSLDQLDLVSGEIFLVRQAVGTGQEDIKDGEKLPEVVETILKQIEKSEDSLIGDIFNNSLYERGYLIENENENATYTKKYSLKRRVFLEITDSFPSLTPSKVDEGILKAQYELKEEIISRFILEEKEVKDKLKNLLK